MDIALLDTDILNEVLKGRNKSVVRSAAAYPNAHGQYALSAMTRFEVVRGLRHRGASHLLAAFATFCFRSLIFPIDDAILDRAADLWVVGRTAGYPHRDADLIIAATALEQGRTLITGNTPHFRWIPGIKIDNWR
jgi:predicted nucleic acid-binding protein